MESFQSFKYYKNLKKIQKIPSSSFFHFLTLNLTLFVSFEHIFSETLILSISFFFEFFQALYSFNPLVIFSFLHNVDYFPFHRNQISKRQKFFINHSHRLSR